jgi:hypothetical protein
MTFSAGWPSEAAARAMSPEDLGVAILFALERADAGRDPMLFNRNNLSQRALEGEAEGWRPGGRMPIVTSVYIPQDS